MLTRVYAHQHLARACPYHELLMRILAHACTTQCFAYATALAWLRATKNSHGDAIKCYKEDQRRSKKCLFCAYSVPILQCRGAQTVKPAKPLAIRSLLLFFQIRS